MCIKTEVVIWIFQGFTKILSLLGFFPGDIGLFIAVLFTGILLCGSDRQIRMHSLPLCLENGFFQLGVLHFCSFTLLFTEDALVKCLIKGYDGGFVC